MLWEGPPECVYAGEYVVDRSCWNSIVRAGLIRRKDGKRNI